jgi:hypothetical protein
MKPNNISQKLLVAMEKKCGGLATVRQAKSGKHAGSEGFA